MGPWKSLFNASWVSQSVETSASWNLEKGESKAVEKGTSPPSPETMLKRCSGCSNSRPSNSTLIPGMGGKLVFSRGGCLCLDACQGGKEKYAVCEPVRLLTCKASRGPTCHTATEGHCRSKSQVIQACTPDHLLYRILDRRDVFTSRLAIGLLWTGVQSPWTVVFSRVDRGGPYIL